jgi:hypothetical protein
LPYCLARNDSILSSDAVLIITGHQPTDLTEWELMELPARAPSPSSEGRSEQNLHPRIARRRHPGRRSHRTNFFQFFGPASGGIDGRFRVEFGFTDLKKIGTPILPMPVLTGRRWNATGLPYWEASCLIAIVLFLKELLW